jgi:hypothetical protein
MAGVEPLRFAIHDVSSRTTRYADSAVDTPAATGASLFRLSMVKQFVTNSVAMEAFVKPDGQTIAHRLEAAEP